MPNAPDPVPMNGKHADSALLGEIAGLIVTSLNLDIPAAEIDQIGRAHV